MVGGRVAHRTIFVSDVSGREIDERDAVRISLRFADARRGTVVVGADPDDPEVKTLLAKGREQARRGRKPKAGAGGG